MGLLSEIQDDAISETTRVSTLLRKVMLLAHRLDSGLLEEWVKFELDGYPEDRDVPDYRQIPLNFKASLSNGFMIHNDAPIAQYLVKKATGREDIDTHFCRQAIGTLDFGSRDHDLMMLNMDNVSLLLRGKAIDKSWEVLRFWAEMPASKVLGIVDAVRNKTLEFTIALQKKYPGIENIEAIRRNDNEVEKAVSQVIYNNHIHGNAGIVGTANSSTVNVTVNHGNLQDLRRQLVQHGVGSEDLLELEASCRQSRSSPTRSLGPRSRVGWERWQARRRPVHGTSA